MSRIAVLAALGQALRLVVQLVGNEFLVRFVTVSVLRFCNSLRCQTLCSSHFTFVFALGNIGSCNFERHGSEWQRSTRSA